MRRAALRWSSSPVWAGRLTRCALRWPMLRAMGLNYKALAVIEKADETGIVFREED